MDNKIIEDFNDYMDRIRNASFNHCAPGGMYDGVEGCKRMAREIGYALPDFTKDEKEIHMLISSTYSNICVRAYHLKPPVDAKVWISEMFLGAKKCLESRNEGKHE